MKTRARDIFCVIRDFLNFLFWTTLGGGILLIAFCSGGWWLLTERSKKERTELGILFTQAIADGTVSGVKDRKFVLTTSHGGMYTFSFTNSLGERAGYFVSRSLPPGQLWEFKELTATNRHVFYRQRLEKSTTPNNVP